MSGPSIQITIDCADPARLAAFWAEALGYEKDPPPEGFDSWAQWLKERNVPRERWNDLAACSDPKGERPRLFFQRVSEPKTVKNRVHLDINAGDRHPDDGERRRLVAEAVERLTAAGGTVVREVEELGESWVVMLDPEGNEFCVQ